MNMLKIVIVAMLIIITGSSCQSQSVKRIGTDTTIIDPVEPVPFDVRVKKPSVILPDSLGGENTTGMAFLKLYINGNAGIDSFEVSRLLTKTYNKVIIDYYKGQMEYPDLQRFYPFLLKFLNNDVEIRKNKYFMPDTTTVMNLMVRFKSSWRIISHFLCTRWAILKKRI